MGLGLGVERGTGGVEGSVRFAAAQSTACGSVLIEKVTGGPMTLRQNIGVLIESASWLTATRSCSQTLGEGDYSSHDGSYLLKLQKDSEIRFGPSYYKAAIYLNNGEPTLDFKERRFFSCSRYGRELSRMVSPWSPTSSRLALPQLLSEFPAPGTNIARMSIFDMSRQTQLAAWDSESLFTHMMWSADGQLYLFRDVFRIYTTSIEGLRLTSLSTSKSPHCFVLENKFVCVIEEHGEILIHNGISGELLESEHISQNQYTVRRTVFVEEQNCVLVLLKRELESDAEGLCYSVRLQL